MAPPGNEYSVGGGGKLKLKGGPVQDGRIEKKKKKKERKKEKEKDTEKENTTSEGAKERGRGRGDDENDIVGLDLSSAKDDGTDSGGNVIERRSRSGSATALSAGEATGVGKTDTEKRYEEVRKKRLNERLKREGVKTHKERVEELNKYLSNLSEHHDMPKIGPG